MSRYVVRSVDADEKYPARTFIHFDLGDGGWRVFSEDEANTDYQAYLEWLAEGNTPEPWEAGQ